MSIRPPHLLAASLLCVPALAFGGCGDDDDDTDKGTPTVIERTVTETAPTTTAPTTRPVRTRCGDVVFEENSGNAAFNVVVEGITCNEAEKLLRSDSGLQSWDCETTESSDSRGGDRSRCRDADRTIGFTGGN